jgi:hypothetical protein
VATISATIGEYRHAVGESEAWNKSVEKQVEAKKAIWRASLEAIGIFMVLIVAFAIAVPLLVDPLDERMLYIVNGISRLTGSVILGLLSIRIALWVGIYYPYRWTEEIHKTLGTTLVELKHRVRWSVSKNFLRSFFILLVMFQEGADPVTIPVSILVGIVCGFLIDYGIYKCRRFESEKTRRCTSTFFVVLVVAFSILTFADGVFFISAVWDDTTEDVSDTYWDAVALLIAAVFLTSVHILVWQLGKRQSETEARQSMQEGADDELSNSRPSPPKQRMATSMIFSDRNVAKSQKEPTASEEENAEERLENVEEAHEKEEEEESPAAVDVADDSDGKEKEEVVPPAMYDPGEVTKDDSNGDDDDEMPPNLWQLTMTQWKFCGCARGDDKTIWRKVRNSINWILYIVVCLACLFLLITNMGSTYQQQAAKKKLPEVNELLYQNIDAGPVCAFDNRGADSNITTFDDQNAAHDAGLLILHCGACSHCSDWHNLELEYTTREFLASESRKCAQVSMFGGGYDALVECLEDDQIGFQGECAICWADDIECTKKYCAMIGLQSFLINTFTNFEVGVNTITAAACEEAHCEAGNPGNFVGCSGATRRRMNVTSSISRRGAQRCSIVDVDWAELFPNPHPLSR